MCRVILNALTHICVSKLTIIGSDNGLSPGRRQAVIWTNTGILLIMLLIRNKLQWNLIQNSYIFIQENAIESVVWKVAAILFRPQWVNDATLATFNEGEGQTKDTKVNHYTDLIMTPMASQITSLTTVVYSIVDSGADQRKHQSSALLAFVWGIHRDRWIPRTKGQ